MKPLHVTLLLLLSTIHTQAAGPQNPFPDQGTFYRGTDLAFHTVETSKARSAASFAEHIFRLPSGHLSPIYGYGEDQHQAVINHITSPQSRYVVLWKLNRDWTFVVSPWNVRRGLDAPVENGILFLQAWQGGVLSPIGYAVVKEGVPEGHSRAFWDTLNRAARTTKGQLLRRFEIDRIITPTVIRG